MSAPSHLSTRNLHSQADKRPGTLTMPIGHDARKSLVVSPLVGRQRESSGSPLLLSDAANPLWVNQVNSGPPPSDMHY